MVGGIPIYRNAPRKLPKWTSWSSETDRNGPERPTGHTETNFNGVSERENTYR